MTTSAGALAAPSLAECEESYQLHFAGQPRLTRDPELLAALIEAAEQAARAPGLPAEEASGARAWAERMRSEHALLCRLQQQAGEPERAAAHIYAHAGLLMHRYSRHFAGRERPGRDLGLLQETAAQLAVLAEDLGRALPGQPDALAAWRQRLAAEAEAIAASRHQEGDARRQAARLAAAANTLMATYQVQVVGRRRLACRPALIDRLAGDLAGLAAALRQLPIAALDAAFHVEVLAGIEQQATAWRSEAAATRAAVQDAAEQAVVEALAGEMDAALEDFNRLGQAAAAPHRGQLAPLCDRLDEVFWRLMSMRDAQGLCWSARDALAMLCGRWDEAPPAAAGSP